MSTATQQNIRQQQESSLSQPGSQPTNYSKLGNTSRPARSTLATVTVQIPPSTSLGQLHSPGSTMLKRKRSAPGRKATPVPNSSARRGGLRRSSKTPSHPGIAPAGSRGPLLAVRPQSTAATTELAPPVAPNSVSEAAGVDAPVKTSNKQQKVNSHQRPTPPPPLFSPPGPPTGMMPPPASGASSFAPSALPPTAFSSFLRSVSTVPRQCSAHSMGQPPSATANATPVVTPMMGSGLQGSSLMDAAFTLDGLPTSELLVPTGSWGGHWGPYTNGPLLGEWFACCGTN